MSESIPYFSTRDATGDHPCSFDALLLTGTAPDGGLYLPAQFPRLDAAPPPVVAQEADKATDKTAGRATDKATDKTAGRATDKATAKAYEDTVLSVLAPYAAGSALESELPALLHAAYTNFHHPDIAPLRQLESNLWLLELFHGPTFSFKDLAMQCLGQLIPALLAKQGKEITILVATSGDTGSAALAAFADKPLVRCIVLYPEGRVSEVQRKQMTTRTARNVQAVAVRGTFDDCQALVKQAFAQEPWRKHYGLTAVNSINWVRLVIQAAYYVAAAYKLKNQTGANKVSFVVPSGNFGNAYAGWVAKQMGAPIATIGIATNNNDILARFLATGTMTSHSVQPTIAPSMDIQVPSNFERLLFGLFNRDAVRTAEVLTEFANTGTLAVEAGLLAEVQSDFWGTAVSEEDIRQEIAHSLRRCEVLLDPHSAIGVFAARHSLANQQAGSETTPVVSLGCAHPAKFPDTVEEAAGMAPETPSALADVLAAREHLQTIDNDLSALAAFLEQGV